MRIEKYYLTRLGEHFPVEKDEGLFKLWESKQHNKYDVLTMNIYPKDFRVTSFNPRTQKYFEMSDEKRKERKKRGKIDGFSYGSVRRLKFNLRNCIDQMTYECGLTYPKEFPTDGLMVKKHFHLLRQRLNYYGYKYIWVLEFQERGAPHFHMLLNKEISEERLKKMWFDIVKSGDQKHLQWGVHVAPIRTQQGMMHYFAGYLEKADQKTVPEEYKNVGRFWGCSRTLLPFLSKKFYGNPEDIECLMSQLRILRRWYNSKKKRVG